MSPTHPTAFTAHEVIDALYRGLLDRPAERAGLEHHLRLLSEGRNLVDLAEGISHSREYFESWLRSGNLPKLAANLWRGEPYRRAEPLIYFLHLMKTGGTALTDGMVKAAGDRFCVTQIFLDQLVVLPSLVLERSSLIAGHLGLEALDLLPDDTVTATIIREPLERTLSHYAHVKADPALATETTGLSLEEFVHAPRWRQLVENFQARSLVHRIGLSSVWRERSPEEMLGQLDPRTGPASATLPLQGFFEASPMELSGRNLHREALERLESIEVVGVTERLDLAFALVTRIWGVEAAALPRANVSQERLNADQVPKSLSRAIREANAVDTALFEAAEGRAAASLGRHAATASGPRRAESAAILASAAAGQMADPGPAVVADRRPWSWSGLGRASRSMAALALLVTLLVAGIDAVAVRGIGLMVFLVLGPCLALLTGRWLMTASIGVLSMGLAVLLGLPDGVWGTANQMRVLVLLLLVSAFSTLAVLTQEQGGEYRTAGSPQRS
ncbi:MAG: hypothetical protein ACYCZV_13575 [Acidimicrobiales bacterium]